jgi:glycosyltransferase involved in cell wall biosynthesis
MKQLLAIAPYPYLSADTRYRICQFIPYLAQAGWQVTLRPFMNDDFFGMYNKPGNLGKKVWLMLGSTISRRVDCLNAGKYDAVFLHKEAFPFGPPYFENLIRQRQPVIIYDMDDAFWTHPPQFKQIGAGLRDKDRIGKVIHLSKHILAGNPFLADYARQYNPDVTLFPTVLDTQRYALREEVDDGVVVIGWVGRWSSSAYLESLVPVFHRLAEQFHNVKFRFIGAETSVLPGDLPLDVKSWSLESEISDIASFDIGIMPLPGDGYSRGKCGFKLLQYMALGIPAVASPIGVNKDIVKDGENGNLASSPQEWEDKLAGLISDFNLRKKIGAKARHTVETGYSLQKWAPRMIEFLNRL